MKFLISPAKKLRTEFHAGLPAATVPEFSQQAQQLHGILRQYSQHDLQQLLGISPAVAQRTLSYHNNWSVDAGAGFQSIWMFQGDVYRGLDIATIDAAGREYINSHVRILSGLYGLLRPSDGIMPYRLEMGAKMPNPAGGNLYAFWKKQLTETLLEQTAATAAIINLASIEYAKALDLQAISQQRHVINISFVEEKNAVVKTIGVYAKHARGRFVRFVAENNITSIEELQLFAMDSYSFSCERSTANTWVFLRRHPVTV